jgi:hypothetical protein
MLKTGKIVCVYVSWLFIVYMADIIEIGIGQRSKLTSSTLCSFIDGKEFVGCILSLVFQ